MKKNSQPKRRLKIADDSLSAAEIYSVILKGVSSTFRSIFKNHYVSENIEALMKFVNSKQSITAEEYKKLLAEAKDFYAVILCALMIPAIKKATKGFKAKELGGEDKKALFTDLQKELTEFFIDWLCHVEIDPLLFYRLSLSYGMDFSMDLCIKSQVSHDLTPIEEYVLRLQMIDIIVNYLIEEVAVHLGIAGLDYIDYYKPQSVGREEKSFFGAKMQEVIG